MKSKSYKTSRILWFIGSMCWLGTIVIDAIDLSRGGDKTVMLILHSCAFVAFMACVIKYSRLYKQALAEEKAQAEQEQEKQG